MKKAILGISAYYHDSAAAILVDGQIVAAAQEERFTRKKHDSSFPINACRYVLQESGINYKDLTAVSFYDKPFLKFERLLETYHAFAPSGFFSFLSAMPVWIKEKLFMRRDAWQSTRRTRRRKAFRFTIRSTTSLTRRAPFIHRRSKKRQSSPLTESANGRPRRSDDGRGKEIEILREMQFPHSVGLLYSAFTYYTGFAVNSGEYKLMGLAPYGNPESQRTADFKKKITTELVDIRRDGSIVLNMDYFEYATGLKMANEAEMGATFWSSSPQPRVRDFSGLHGYGARDSAGDGRHRASSCLHGAATDWQQISGAGRRRRAELRGQRKDAESRNIRRYLDSAGRRRRRRSRRRGLAVWHIHEGNERQSSGIGDAMSGSYLGPEFSDKEICAHAAEIRRERRATMTNFKTCFGCRSES